MGSKKNGPVPDFVPFMNSLNALFEKTGRKNKELAEYLETVESSVTHYRKGHALPDALKLVKIAEFFNTTTDYLLGQAVADSATVSDALICDSLGLSDAAIQKLKGLSLTNKAVLNRFIESEEFTQFLTQCASGILGNVDLRNTTFSDCVEESAQVLDSYNNFKETVYWEYTTSELIKTFYRKTINDRDFGVGIVYLRAFDTMQGMASTTNQEGG